MLENISSNDSSIAKWNYVNCITWWVWLLDWHFYCVCHLEDGKLPHAHLNHSFQPVREEVLHKQNKGVLNCFMSNYRCQRVRQHWITCSTAGALDWAIFPLLILFVLLPYVLALWPSLLHFLHFMVVDLFIGLCSSLSLFLLFLGLPGSLLTIGGSVVAGVVIIEGQNAGCLMAFIG